MDRRFLTVLGVSLLFALVVSSVFYQFAAGKSSGGRTEVETKEVVVAARPLSVGTMVKPGDVKVAKVATGSYPKGAFEKVEDVLDRPVVSNILLEEPILDGRLAARGSGMGLAPVIPVGMRAVSVRVNEVVGVAGFVLPGMRVDVLVTGRPPDYEGTMTNTVLQNILVLSAGQTITPDNNDGRAINSATVTLLVTPEQAETMTLAGNEGRIQLVLRNGTDNNVAATPGRDVRELYGRRAAPKSAPEPEERPRPRPRAVTVAVAPPPPPPAPKPVVEEIVMIRGTKRTVETVGRTDEAEKQ